MYLYGIASLGELRNTKARNRSFFVDDLRNQRYEYRDMKMLLEVLTISSIFVNILSPFPFVKFIDIIFHISLFTHLFLWD